MTLIVITTEVSPLVHCPFVILNEGKDPVGHRHPG
jgi:hypothetical protein